MANRFSNQVVVITGASSGIGEALAFEIAKQGGKLALLARRTDRLGDVEAQIKRIGGEAIAVRCDVTSESDLAAAAETVKKRFGKIDVLVVNAGYSVAGNFEWLKMADYRKQMETNVFGALGTTYAFLPYLKESKGTVVPIGSVMSYLAIPGTSPYAMSKFALRAWFEAVEGELKKLGISMTFIAPGFIATEIRKVDNAGHFDSSVTEDVPAWIQMPSEKAARIIAKAIASKKRLQIVTQHAHLIIFVARFMPWILRLATRLGVKRERGNVRPGSH